MKKKALVYILLSLLSLIAIYSMVNGFNRAVYAEKRSQDFQWSGSRMLLNKENPYQKFLDWKNGEIEKPIILSQAPNYPVSSLAFLWPYAALDWENAKLWWAISNIIFTIFIIVGLQILFPIKRIEIVLLIFILFVCGASWRTLLGCGQHDLYVLAFFIWAIILSKKSKFISAFFLSLSWLKYTISFPLSVFFITKKNYKILIIGAIIHLSVTIFISFWTNEPITKFIEGPLKVALRATNIGVVDIWGIIKTYDIPKIVGIFVVAGFILLTIRVIIYNLKKPNDLLLLTFLSLISMAIIFHQPYDFIVLIFPLWYILSGQATNRYFIFLLIGLIAMQWYLIPALNTLVDITDIPILKYTEITIDFAALIFFYLSIFSIANELKNYNKISLETAS